MNTAEFLWSNATPFYPVYEEEEGEAPSEEPKVEEPKSKTFTQSDVDRIVKERLERERKKQEEEKSELINRLSELEKNTSMPDEERTALKQRIEELRSENLSTEEKLTREQKKLQEELDKTRSQYENELNRWRSEHTNYRITNELREAANANDARTPEQLVEILQKRTELKEVVNDDGAPTGRYEVKTTITKYKEDGTPFEVELNPMEAVQALREMPDKWGNQFNSKSKPGVDMMTHTDTSDNTSGLVLGKGLEAYKKSRERNAELLGLRR